MKEEKFKQIMDVLDKWENSQWGHIDIFIYNMLLYKEVIMAIINDKEKNK